MPGLGAGTPNNTTTGTTYQYVGEHQKLTETTFSINVVQMGARLYIPTLGRFLQVDPIEGGVDNSYVYPPDGVNELDLDGNVAVLAVLGAAVYIGGIALSAYEFYKNPTPVNAIWLGIAVMPGVGAVAWLSKAKYARPLLKVLGSKGGQGAGKYFGKAFRKASLSTNKKCAYGCGRDATELDHVYPRSAGGNNTKANSQGACRQCNASKSNRAFPNNYPLTKKIGWVIKRALGR